MFPLLPVLLTAFQEGAAGLRHASQRLKWGQGLRRTAGDVSLEGGRTITWYSWVQMASMKDTCMLGIWSFFSRFIRS